MKPLNDNKLQILFLFIFITFGPLTMTLGFNNGPYVILALLIPSYFFMIRKIKKQRKANLKVFAEKNNYEYLEAPDENFLRRFNNFKSLNWVASEKLFNLLVSSKGSDNPHIVTARKVISNHDGPDSIHYTQLFLFDLEKEIPVFFIRKKSWFEDLLPARDKAIISICKLTDYYLSYPKNKKFPSKKYFCFVKDDAFENFVSDKFIELLNLGIQKRKRQINIESDGRNLMFYAHHKRHSQEDMAYYINLFKALKNSLLQ